MELSLVRLDQDLRLTALGNSLDIVLATTAGRQAATPTARLATRLALGPSSPVHGSFDRATALLLTPATNE